MRAKRMFALVVAGTIAWTLSSAQLVVAQEAPSTRAFFNFKVGANAQSAEDNENGTSLGFGFGAGYWVSRRWGFEFEAWLPNYIQQDDKEFRDRIFSGSVIFRSSPRGRYAPYYLAGIGIAQVQSRSEFGSYSNAYNYFQVGAGVEIALNRHLAIAPELRANIGISSFILRPALAAVIRF